MLKNLRFINIVLFCSYSFLFSTNEWQEVQTKAENAVVQIYSHGAKFDWLYPFKAPKLEQGAGSGFFINKDGYLITNFHVIDEAKSAFIFMPVLGKLPLMVKVISVCPEADVALLQLTEESLKIVREKLHDIPYLDLGDSDNLVPTEPVLALGFPLGQRYPKSTVGVIAGREYIWGKSFMHMTAPINKGNSGGPLLNSQGKVVGINSAGIPFAQNIGYIIPINDVKILLSDLNKVKLLRKPDLGIRVNNTTQEHALSLGNPWPAGIYISHVAEKSAGEKLGLKAGDMLYEINNLKVDQYGDVTVKWRSGDKVSFNELLIRFPVNEKLELIVYRKGQRIKLSGNFEIPTIYPIRYIYPDYEPDTINHEIFAGMCIMELRDNHFPLLPQTALLKKYAQMESQNEEVLVITAVLPGSLADKIDCFRAGTLIESVNNIKVRNLAQLKEALLKSVETGQLAISTKDYYSTVISLDNLLKEEPKLAYSFKFAVSPTIKKIWELTQKRSSCGLREFII